MKTLGYESINDAVKRVDGTKRQRVNGNALKRFKRCLTGLSVQGLPSYPQAGKAAKTGVIVNPWGIVQGMQPSGPRFAR